MKKSRIIAWLLVAALSFGMISVTAFADEADEITLEKRFAAENDYKVGSVIKIGEKDFTVTGIGSSVDYDAPYRKLSDTNIDSSTFGIGFLTEEGYEELKKSGGGSEELTYAFLLGDNTASDFKEMVKDFDFDYKKVKDPYYQEMLSDTYGKKDVCDPYDNLQWRDQEQGLQT